MRSEIVAMDEGKNRESGAAVSESMEEFGKKIEGSFGISDKGVEERADVMAGVLGFEVLVDGERIRGEETGGSGFGGEESGGEREDKGKRRIISEGGGGNNVKLDNENVSGERIQSGEVSKDGAGEAGSMGGGEDEGVNSIIDGGGAGGSGNTDDSDDMPVEISRHADVSSSLNTTEDVDHNEDVGRGRSQSADVFGEEDSREEREDRGQNRIVNGAGDGFSENNVDSADMQVEASQSAEVNSVASTADHEGGDENVSGERNKSVEICKDGFGEEGSLEKREDKGENRIVNGDGCENNNDSAFVQVEALHSVEVDPTLSTIEDVGDHENVDWHCSSLANEGSVGGGAHVNGEEKAIEGVNEEILEGKPVVEGGEAGADSSDLHHDSTAHVALVPQGEGINGGTENGFEDPMMASKSDRERSEEVVMAENAEAVKQEAVNKNTESVDFSSVESQSLRLESQVAADEAPEQAGPHPDAKNQRNDLMDVTVSRAVVSTEAANGESVGQCIVSAGWCSATLKSEEPDNVLVADEAAVVTEEQSLNPKAEGEAFDTPGEKGKEELMLNDTLCRDSGNANPESSDGKSQVGIEDDSAAVCIENDGLPVVKEGQSVEDEVTASKEPEFSGESAEQGSGIRSPIKDSNKILDSEAGVQGVDGKEETISGSMIGPDQNVNIEPVFHAELRSSDVFSTACTAEVAKMDTEMGLEVIKQVPHDETSRCSIEGQEVHDEGARSAAVDDVSEDIPCVSTGNSSETTVGQDQKTDSLSGNLAHSDTQNVVEEKNSSANEKDRDLHCGSESHVEGMQGIAMDIDAIDHDLERQGLASTNSQIYENQHSGLLSCAYPTRTPEVDDNPSVKDAATSQPLDSTAEIFVRCQSMDVDVQVVPNSCASPNSDEIAHTSHEVTSSVIEEKQVVVSEDKKYNVEEKLNMGTAVSEAKASGLSTAGIPEAALDAGAKQNEDEEPQGDAFSECSTLLDESFAKGAEEQKMLCDTSQNDPSEENAVEVWEQAEETLLVSSPKELENEEETTQASSMVENAVEVQGQAEDNQQVAPLKERENEEETAQTGPIVENAVTVQGQDEDNPQVALLKEQENEEGTSQRGPIVEHTVEVLGQAEDNPQVASPKEQENEEGTTQAGSIAENAVEMQEQAEDDPLVVSPKVQENKVGNTRTSSIVENAEEMQQQAEDTPQVASPIEQETYDGTTQTGSIVQNTVEMQEQAEDDPLVASPKEQENNEGATQRGSIVENAEVQQQAEDTPLVALPKEQENEEGTTQTGSIVENAEEVQQQAEDTPLVASLKEQENKEGTTQTGSTVENAEVQQPADNTPEVASLEEQENNEGTTQTGSIVENAEQVQQQDEDTPQDASPKEQESSGGATDTGPIVENAEEVQQQAQDTPQVASPKEKEDAETTQTGPLVENAVEVLEQAVDTPLVASTKEQEKGEECTQTCPIAENAVEVLEQAEDTGQVSSPEEQGKDKEPMTDANKKSQNREHRAKRGSSRVGGMVNDHRVSYQLPPENEGEFSVYDLVWGKVKSHPWWPGQIFHPSDSSEKAMKYYRKDCYLVAYFGDRTFAWNEASQLKPFRKHCSQEEKQSVSESFQNAVNDALKEVSRRVELGLACSCITEEAYNKIKFQIVENSGICKESSGKESLDRCSVVDSFQPDKLIHYIRALALSPTSGADRLSLVIVKAQLLAFSQQKGYDALPDFQYYEGLVECDGDTSLPLEQATSSEVKHTVSVGVSDGKSKGPLKRKHNLKDIVYQRRKDKGLSELMDEYYIDSEYELLDQDDSVLTSPTSGKRRKGSSYFTDGPMGHEGPRTVSLAIVSQSASPSPQQSFKIGDCIRRVASQLTGSPSVTKCGSDETVMDAGDDNNELLETPDDSKSGRMIVPTEESAKESTEESTKESSLDDRLSQLRLSAQDPMKRYSFSKDILSFFSKFRTLAISAQVHALASARKAGPGRKRKPSVAVDGSPETFECNDRNDPYWKDMVVQNNPEKKPARRGRKRKDHSVPNDSGKLLQSSSRRKPRKQYYHGNHEPASEPSNDEVKHHNLLTELVLTFNGADSLPSEANLNKMFRRFGPLKEGETGVDRQNSRARVVFKRGSDAEVAYSSAAMFNIFGSTLVNYQLNYIPPVSVEPPPLALTPGQPDTT